MMASGSRARGGDWRGGWRPSAERIREPSEPRSESHRLTAGDGGRRADGQLGERQSTQIAGGWRVEREGDRVGTGVGDWAEWASD